jgi:hypothetical protein
MSSFRLDPLTNAGVAEPGPPITSTLSLTRRQELDRYSSWEFDMSTSDPALSGIEGRDFNVYWLRGDKTFFLGRCSYLDHVLQSASRVAVRATGTLRDLSRQTALQYSFDGASATVNTVLSTLVPLRAGWGLGAVETVAKAAPMDFWYESLFEAVSLLATTFNKHFREGGPKTLDFGSFGEQSGILAMGGSGAEFGPESYARKDRCQITEVAVEYQGGQVVNRLIAFGGAIGTATIDLSLVTQTQSGYPVSSAALPGGGSYYYIQDATSISTYGLTERRFLRKDLRPISNSPAARIYAANILYEAALASLLNLKDRQTIYSLAVTGLEPGRLQVGDKLSVFYRGWAETADGPRQWLEIDAGGSAVGGYKGGGKSFYVLEIEESFSGDGVQTRLAINENAVKAERIEDILASTIRTFEQSQIHVQPTISRYTVGPYTKRVSASPAVSATFSFKLGPETLTVWYVIITLTGDKLKSSVESVTGASTTTPSGGGSTTVSGGGSTTPSGGGGTTPSGGGHTTPSGGSSTTPSGGGGTTPSGGLGGHRHSYPGDPGWTNDTTWAHVHDIPDHTHSTPSHQHTVSNHTHDTPAHTHSTPNHTHDTPAHQHTFTPNVSLAYGIFEDSVRPSSLTIKVNGSTVATGVTLSAGNSYTYEQDITANILAAGTLQQEHTITVECGSNRGEIQFQAQVLAVIQGIAVS